MYQANLAVISKSIISAATIAEEIQSAKLLSDFFLELTEFNLKISNPKEETKLQGGVALSINDAAICVDDYIRTARFIKAVYCAMKELLAKFPFTKNSILYAGCGPYATLLLPLLPLFAEDDFDITLLDINETSIQSIQKLIEKFGLKNYHIKTTCGNAITYKHKHAEEKPLHLIITETMFRALTREPQAAITANLAPQLAEGGILIPEEIELNMSYSFFAKEPFLQNGTNAFEPLKILSAKKYDKRVFVGTLFSMNKHYNFSDAIHNNTFTFESPFYKLPKNFTDYPDVCIYTNICIFKDFTLGLAESYITNPHCVASLFNFANHTQVKLIYTYKDVPGWSCELK